MANVKTVGITVETWKTAPTFAVGDIVIEKCAGDVFLRVAYQGCNLVRLRDGYFENSIYALFRKLLPGEHVELTA